MNVPRITNRTASNPYTDSTQARITNQLVDIEQQQARTLTRPKAPPRVVATPGNVDIEQQQARTLTRPKAPARVVATPSNAEIEQQQARTLTRPKAPAPVAEPVAAPRPPTAAARPAPRRSRGSYVRRHRAPPTRPPPAPVQPQTEEAKANQYLTQTAPSADVRRPNVPPEMPAPTPPGPIGAAARPAAPVLSIAAPAAPAPAINAPTPEPAGPPPTASLFAADLARDSLQSFTPQDAPPVSVAVTAAAHPVSLTEINAVPPPEVAPTIKLTDPGGHQQAAAGSNKEIAVALAGVAVAAFLVLR